MGVLHPEQIDRFSVNSIAYTDILKIVYERPKGSMLPVTRTYKFPRIQKPAKADNDTHQTEAVMESHPDLRAALDELQDIIQTKGHKQDVTAAILEELRLLDEDIACRSDCIKSLLGDIQRG